MSTRTAAAGIFLIALHLIIFFAGLFSPYHYSEQHRDFPLSPPMKPRFVDAEGRMHCRPFVYGWVATEDGSYREDITNRYPIRFFVKGSTYRTLGMLPMDRHVFGVDPPGRIFLLGTDSYGRDTFTRLLHGGRVSLAAGLLGLSTALSLALTLGGLAGYYGGWLDDILMRLSELLLALPWLYLLFAVRAFLPLNLEPWQTFALIVSLLGLVGWVQPMRLIRGVALTAKEREFVGAARSFGASDFYLFRRHVLPQLMGVLVTQATVLIPMYILAEVTLSFLGLGISEPLPSWGNMLAELQQYHILATSRWMFAPGIALVLITWLYYSLLTAFQDRPVALHL